VTPPLAPIYVPRTKHGVEVIILPAVGDRDVEMGETACAQQVDLVDVEMEDDFLPPIPAIIVNISSP
jgi:hypothetical protein